MVNRLTGTQQFTRPVQFIEEVTEGTTPGVGAWTAVGQALSLSYKTDGGFVETAQIGPEDINALSQGLQGHTFTVRYRASSSAFIKRAINAQNFATPTGTISASLSVMFGIYLNGPTENFIIFKGVRAKSCTVTAELGRPTEFSIDFVALSIAVPATTTPGGTLVSAFPTAAVYDWLSGGTTTPLRWGTDSAAGQVPATRFTVTIERNTNVDFTLGNANAIGSLPHGRRISGEFTLYWNLDLMGNASTLENDFRNGTARLLKYYMSSTTDYLDFGSTVKLTAYSRDHDSEDTNALVETAEFKALTVLAAP